jgi:hypothetical protein
MVFMIQIPWFIEEDLDNPIEINLGSKYLK